MDKAITALNKAEQAFGSKILKSTNHRSFYRAWRNVYAKTNRNAWSEFRDAIFINDAKTLKGSSIASALRTHLVELQGGRCCYCRRQLQRIAYARPVEHILPRKDYPQFTFYYRNLAVACYDCNATKTANNWSGISKKNFRYPGAHKCTDFFHPRFHIYSEHVHYIHVSTNETTVSLYQGITEQGRQICRDLLHASARRELIVGANDRLGAAVDKLQNHAADIDPSAHASFYAFLECLDEAISDLAQK